jgi:hypothetical protein
MRLAVRVAIWCIALTLPPRAVCAAEGPAEGAGKDEQEPPAAQEVVLKGVYQAPRLVPKQKPDGAPAAGANEAAQAAAPEAGEWIPPPPAIGTLKQANGSECVLATQSERVKALIQACDGKEVTLVGRWLTPGQVFLVQNLVDAKPTPGRGSRGGRGRNL